MDRLTYGSVCSGIEAATVAWHPLGWKPAWFAEIDKFPSSVLAHHYPNVPNYGDFTKITAERSGPIDLLVGGTPCQAFSVAGRRAGLDDPRGNLTLEFLVLAARIQPSWIVWENVPGVLSIDKGRTFGAFLYSMGKLGYGFAYRILDAQYFGVPQRRRRIFVVGCFGNWRAAAAVLFEQEGMCGDIAKSGEKGKDFASFTPSSIGGYSEGIGTLRSNGGDIVGGSENIIAFNLRGREGGSQPEMSNLASVRSSSGGSSRSYVTFEANMSQQSVFEGDTYQTITRRTHASILDRGIRRLTAKECERLQGFQDNYTLVPYPKKLSADGPRYKAIGNSMAVPVMRWIGQRIDIVNGAICQEQLAA